MSIDLRRRPSVRRGTPKWDDFIPPADIDLDDLWTPDAVKDRLVEAAKICERFGGRVLPKAYGSSMPKYRYDWGDLIGQAETNELGKGGNRILIGTTTKQMTRVEEAMMWPMRYLECHRLLLPALQMFLRCKARRQSFNEAIRKAGLSKSTVFRARDRCLAIIAMGLVRDRVQLRLARSDDDPDRDD